MHMELQRDVWTWFKSWCSSTSKTTVSSEQSSIQYGYQKLFPWEREMVPMDMKYCLHGLHHEFTTHRAPEDQEVTTFSALKGLFCYDVIPSGLKNVRATCKSAMLKIFEDLMHKVIKHYVDELIVKSKKWDDHLQVTKFAFSLLMVPRRRCSVTNENTPYSIYNKLLTYHKI